MLTEPRPPDLVELTRILERCVGTYQSCALSPQHAATLLQHMDELVARLAAVEADRDRAVRDVQLMQGAFAAVVAERDEARPRATRLAALEQAARAWRHTKSEAAWEALGDALVALDAPPPEQP